MLHSNSLCSRTGLGTTDEWQVTVTGQNAMVADGLASAACVGGAAVFAYYPEYERTVLVH